MERNTTKEKKTRKLLVEAQRRTIEAGRILDNHAARVFADKAIANPDEALEWLQEPASKEGQ